MVSTRFLAVLLILDGIASEAIARIPIPWIGMALVIIPAASITFGKNSTNLSHVLLILVLLYILYSAMVSVVNWEYYCDDLPAGATTNYPVFISLRYFHFVAFASMALFVYVLCSQGKAAQSTDVVVKLGAIVACYAIYVYFAHLFDLPELLPRSRMGTGLGEQATTFSGLSNRALGSFREPSHLAEWLMVPFTLSFICDYKYSKYAKIVIALAILLSASLTAIMSMAIALLIIILIYRPPLMGNKKSGRSMPKLFPALALMAILILIIDLALSGRFLENILFRSEQILEGGLRESNRGFLYKYLDTLPNFPWFGVGLGNANIDFSNATGNPAVVAFPNLYASSLLSSGKFGLAIMCCILAYPVLKIFAYGKNRLAGQNYFFILWGYLAWLISFGVHAEELPIMFGVAYGLLLHCVPHER